MTKLNFFKNRRLLTIVFLFITFVFAGLAVFLAITLNNRSTNPDNTSAITCSGGEYEDSTTCPGKAFCCPVGKACQASEYCPESQCTIVDEGLTCNATAGCALGEGKQKRTRKCPGKPDEDVSDASCTAKDDCNKPSGGGDLKLCNVYRDATKCADQPGTAETCGAYGLACDGTKVIGTGIPLCNGQCTVDQAAVPLPTVTPADSTGWASGSNCRYRTGQGATCGEAQFASGACSPAAGEMCFCRNEVSNQPRDGWTYGRAETQTFQEGKCDASCIGKNAGTYSAPKCNNPYACPAVTIVTPTPPPAPLCNTDCINNENVTKCGEYVVRRVPKQCGTTTQCESRQLCEGPDFVVYDCNGNEVSRQVNHPACLPQIASCTSLTVSASGDSNASSATTSLTSTDYSVYPRIPAAGELFTFSTNPFVPAGETNVRYEIYIRPIGADANNACSFYTFAGVGAATGSWKMPANGATRTESATAFRQFEAGYPAFTECSSTPLDFSQGFYVGQLTETLDNNRAWCASQPERGFPNGVIVNGGGLNGQSCANYCVVKASNAPVTTVTTANVQCSNLQVTNTRTSETCSGSNPTCTAFRANLKQGDTLSATLTGTSGVTGYSLTTTPAYTGQATTPQASGAFSNITIPTTTSLASFDLRGSVTNGSSTDAPGACALSFTLASNPEVDKVINAGASTGLGAGNVVTSSSIVQYDVTFSNSGQNILQNVIAVDRLTAYDPSTGAPVTPAFGDIVRATNLTRGGGSLSQPGTVAPRIGLDGAAATVAPNNAALPNDNFTAGQDVKSVEWTRITSFFPGENYTGSVRVDIDSFTGTPTLRNQVCLYNDTNNNGIYDNGDTQIRCDEVLVVTQTPNFTITKTASDSNLSVGDSFTYTLTLTNTSASSLDLSNVTVTDTLDPTRINGITVANISSGGTRASNVITWSGANLTTANGGNSSLAAAGTLTLTFQVTVNDAYFTSVSECSGQMINDVRAVSTSPAYTYIAPTVTVIVNRQCGEGFTVTKTANPTTFTPGQTITYTAVVTNRGDTAAPVVRITDDFATGFTYQTGTARFTKPDGTSFTLDPSIANGVATWNFPLAQQVTLNPGQSMSFVYKMTATNATSGTYPNTVCVEVPDGGCDSAVVLPRTGIITTAIAIIGIGLVAAGVHMYRKGKRGSVSK